MDDQLRALDLEKAKLEARNLEMETELACAKSGRRLVSPGAQHSRKDNHLPSVEAKPDLCPEAREKICSTGGILEAARHGDLVQLRAMLETCTPEEVNVTTKPEGLSALHLAAKAGHAEAVDLLLGSENFKSSNSRTSAKQHHGATALHIAAYEGHERVTSLLLNSARFTAASARSSLGGGTALHSAAFAGHAAVADLLLKSHRFEDEAVNAVDKYGSTALHIAAFANHVNVLALLLKSTRFCKVGASNELFHATALHVAAEEGHSAAAAALLDAPRFCNAAVNAVNSEGRTALHLAVRAGHHRAALLLKSSPRFTAIGVSCSAGKTALDLARHKRDQEMMALLRS